MRDQPRMAQVEEASTFVCHRLSQEGQGMDGPV